MKKSTALAVIAMITASTVFTNCKSPDQKVDDAQTKVQDAKKDLNTAQDDAAVTAQKAAANEEWQLFKTQSEAKIKENDLSIAQLKEKMKSSGKKLDDMFTKNIESLEKKNKDLSDKIANYDKGRSDWEAFKREFNHDMDEFGNAFKDLTVNNKK